MFLAALVVLGKLGPGRLGPCKLGPRQIGPGKFWVRQIGPRKILSAANWALEVLLVANQAPANRAPADCAPWRQTGPWKFCWRQIKPRQIGPLGGKLGPGKLGPGIMLIWLSFEAHMAEL